MQAQGESTPRLREVSILIILGIGVALVRVLALAHPQRIVWGDEPFYLWLGRNWLTGRGYSFTGYSDVHHTPMYPLLTGLVYLVTRDLELASDICYVLFGALLAIPVYLLAREMYRREVGYASVALLAIYPAISTAPAFWGTLTEAPYYFFVYSGLLMALLAMRRERNGFYILAGAFFGLAYLTRPEAVAYVAATGGVLVLVRLFERRLLARATLVGLTLFAVGFLLFFVPYAYYVYQETGAWMVSEKAGVTFVTCLGLSEGDTKAFDEATWGLDTTGCEVFFFSRESYDVSMVDVILAYPSEFAQLVVRNVRRHTVVHAYVVAVSAACVGADLFQGSLGQVSGQGRVVAVGFVDSSRSLSAVLYPGSLYRHVAAYLGHLAGSGSL
jgi:4-amino-4-deoxy-L-arabinose transferase-like glycosyltransferase